MGLLGVQRDPEAPPRTRRTLAALAGTDQFVDNAAIYLDGGRVALRLAGSSGLEVTADGLAIAADVPIARLQTIATDRLIGRDTTGSGVPEELTLSSGLSFTGSGGIQITDGSVTDAMLRDSAACSVIGRSAATTDDPTDLGAVSEGDYLRRHTVIGFGAILQQDLPAATTSTQGAVKKSQAVSSAPSLLITAHTAAGAPYDTPIMNMINDARTDLSWIHFILSQLLAQLRACGQLES